MHEYQLAVSAPADFNFWRTVLSHGWSSLPPFHLELESRRLLSVLNTSCQAVLLEMEEVDERPRILIRSYSSMTQEDVIKMLCTTNCTWSATQRMSGNLVCRLGKSFSQGYADFPSPGQLASTTETFLIQEIRSGYRSAYILQFAENVASGSLDLSLWEQLDSKTLY